MPFIPALIAGAGGLIGSLVSGNQQSQAIKGATDAQNAASQAAIAEQQREFNTNQTNLQPWLQSGQSALSQQDALLGLGGSPQGASAGQPNYSAYVQGNPDLLADFNANGAKDGYSSMDAYGQAHWQQYGQNENRQVTPTSGQAASSGTAAQQQQAAISQLQQSPLYQSLFNTGQQTILANAAATGGLRGGNTQNSLARFGSDTLAQTIQQQLQNLGTVSGAGQSAAGTLGQLGSNSTNQISNLTTQQGANTAGGILGQGAINGAQINNLISGGANLAGQFGSLFGSGGSTSAPTSTLFNPQTSAQILNPNGFQIDPSLYSVAF